MDFTIYCEILEKIHRSQSVFDLGNGFPFRHASGERNLGLRLELPKEVIDICNEFLSSLGSSIDTTKVKVPDNLVFPLSKGLSPTAVHNLLKKVESDYPNGVPLGIAQSIAVTRGFRTEHASHYFFKVAEREP